MTQVPSSERAPSLDIRTVTAAANIARLVPYRHGKSIAEVQRETGITDIIKLASNENSLGPSPKAQQAVHEYASKMHHYPDAVSYDLRIALASRLGMSPDGIVFGNRSDDIIHLLGITYLEAGDEVIQGNPSFVRYTAAATLNNAPCHLVPLTSDWVHDLPAMADRVNDNTRLVFIANPNNPTGTIVGKEALTRFLDRMPERVIVVLDEAYHEYATTDPNYADCMSFIREGRNVVGLRTFSKAYGLAGLRIGYGLMRPEIADWLNRTREPFNVNLLAQAAAIAALTDEEHVARTIAMNESGKTELYSAFDGLGLDYSRTSGNFVWVDVRRDCAQAFDALLHQGVITRTGDIFGAPTHLRITIGTAEENHKLLAALRTFINGGAA